MRKSIKIGLITVASSVGLCLAYYLFKRRFFKKRLTYDLTSPFIIPTSNRQLIGFTKGKYLR